MTTLMQKKILVVDDEEDVRESVALILNKKLRAEGDYSVITCGNAHDAIAQIKENDIDVMISDIKMPEVSGMELLDRSRSLNKKLPVLLMTAHADMDLSIKALRQGAFDFIMKPLQPDYLLLAVKRAIQHNNLTKFKDQYKFYLEHEVAERTNELITAQNNAESFSRELIRVLTTVAEFRDTEAGAHICRIGMYAEAVTRNLGMPRDFVRNIKEASPLHDIGKLSITDYILFKLGPLTSQEEEIMKTHTTEGARILRGSSNPIIQMAESIALNHHERWDGTGYPRGLKGEEIPIEGRIASLCDAYDAIRTERVYKPAYSHEETVSIITKGDGRTMPAHFAPDVLSAFYKISPKFDEIYKSYDDNLGRVFR